MVFVVELIQPEHTYLMNECQAILDSLKIANSTDIIKAVIYDNRRAWSNLPTIEKKYFYELTVQQELILPNLNDGAEWQQIIMILPNERVILARHGLHNAIDLDFYLPSLQELIWLNSESSKPIYRSARQLLQYIKREGQTEVYDRLSNFFQMYTNAD